MTDRFDDLVRTKQSAQETRDAISAHKASARAAKLSQLAEAARERAKPRLPEALQAAALLQSEGRRAIRKIYFYDIQPGYERRADTPPFPSGMEFSRKALGRGWLWIFRPGWRVGSVCVPLRHKGEPMVVGPERLISLTALVKAGRYRLASGIDVEAAQVLTDFTNIVAEYLASLRTSCCNAASEA